jgi:hypothetical protein
LPHRDEPGGGRPRPLDPGVARHLGGGRPRPVDPGIARHLGGGRPRPVDSGIARRGACPRGGTIPTVRVPRVPIYTPASVRPVHNLHYDWTGWFDPTATGLETLEHRLGTAVAACRGAWITDGITLDTWALSRTATGAPRLQCLFTASPEVSPVLCAGRAKGRLDHALRQAGLRQPFSRNIGFRSLGENTREIVERYIGRQAAKSDYIDPRFKAYLGQFTVGDAAAMLAAPCAAGHGRYWYNLHLSVSVGDGLAGPPPYTATRRLGRLSIADSRGLTCRRTPAGL